MMYVTWEYILFLKQVHLVIISFSAIEGNGGCLL